MEEEVYDGEDDEEGAGGEGWKSGEMEEVGGLDARGRGWEGESDFLVGFAELRNAIRNGEIGRKGEQEKETHGSPLAALAIALFPSSSRQRRLSRMAPQLLTPRSEGHTQFSARV